MASSPELAIDMRGISRRFGVVDALVEANLRVRCGSIHGLVGQNGAGKSTLVKILAGIVKPDAGTLRIHGKTVARPTPALVERLGVHIIHQDRLLVPTATVAEAIFLHHEPRFGPFVRHRNMARRARALLNQYFDLDLAPDMLVQELTAAQQKIIQITRALAQKASVLVLDEPTAALVKTEVESLFLVLRRLRDAGIAVIFISHYMKEIAGLCDTVTVMRNGTDVGVVNPRTTSIEGIITMMTNRDVGEMFPRRDNAVGAPLLQVSGLTMAPHFRDVSFAVKAGEIVGFAGLLGSGAKELIRCLFGLDHPDRGNIHIADKAVRFASPESAVAHGVALVPEDRRAHGVALELSVRENISLASLSRYSPGGFVSRARENDVIDGLIGELSIKAPHRDAPVKTLSGGNQQKVALAKWLARQSRVYLLDEPTVAVDVAAKIEIYTLLNRLAAQGAAIILISSDLLELAGFCDRVLVIHRGELVNEYAADGLNSDLLLAAVSGVATRRIAA